MLEAHIFRNFQGGVIQTWTCLNHPLLGRWGVGGEGGGNTNVFLVYFHNFLNIHASDLSWPHLHFLSWRFFDGIDPLCYLDVHQWTHPYSLHQVVVLEPSKVTTPIYCRTVTVLTVNSLWLHMTTHWTTMKCWQHMVPKSWHGWSIIITSLGQVPWWGYNVAQPHHITWTSTLMRL